MNDGVGLWQKDFLITVTLWQIPKPVLVPQFPVRVSDRTLWNYVTGLGVLIPARVSTKMWGMLILSVSQTKMVWNFMKCQECKYSFIASLNNNIFFSGGHVLVISYRIESMNLLTTQRFLVGLK